MESITGGLTAAGKLDGVTIDDLSPVDEFHVGGRAATEQLMARLDLGPDDDVLDVGCGIGGAARYCAATFGCSVTGIDLTSDFVETATALTKLVGLEAKATFRLGSADNLRFKKHTFDVAYMLHVGMNLSDKTGVFSGIATALKTGGRFGVYDLMRVNDKPVTYPTPWATNASTSFIASPESYEASLEAVGFTAVERRDRSDLATGFIAQLRAGAGSGDGPPPLGLHLVMGPTIATKVANMIAAIEVGALAPFEIVAVKGR